MLKLSRRYALIGFFMFRTAIVLCICTFHTHCIVLLLCNQMYHVRQRAQGHQKSERSVYYLCVKHWFWFCCQEVALVATIQKKQLQGLYYGDKRAFNLIGVLLAKV